ncbi:hypothetical protein GCM10009815_28250 [Nocardioides marmoribigeumensis]
MAQRALERLVALPDVTRAGFAVSEGGRRQLLFTATDRGDEGGSFEWCRIDAAWEVPLNGAARDGELVAGTLEELEPRFPSFVGGQADTGIRYVAAAPVSYDGEHLGGFVLYFDRVQQGGPQLVAGLVDLGRSIGKDLATTRHEQRRRAPARAARAGRGPGAVLSASHEMPGEPGAVGHARRFLRTVLEDWGLDAGLVGDAVLCLDELATNALVHTHGGCRVHVTLAGRVLRVRVADHGGLGPIRVAPTPPETAAHGRGLEIVGALASRSGRDPVECLAWFELDLPERT